MTIDPLLLVATLPVLAAVGWRIRVEAERIGYRRGYGARLADEALNPEMVNFYPERDIDALNAMHRPPRCA